MIFPRLLYIAGSQDFQDRETFFSHLEQLLAGGLRWFQFRDKRLPDNELYRWAMEIRQITSRYGAILTINDRPDIALLSGADGTHLGQEDIPSMTDKVLPPEMKHCHVGLSTHNPYEVKRAILLSPDYLGVGPISNTATKTLEHAPRGVGAIRETRMITDLPLVAIGGITTEMAPSLYQAGAQTIAISGALTKSASPVAVLKEFLSC